MFNRTVLIIDTSEYDAHCKREICKNYAFYQGSQNGFEHGRDRETSITFEPDGDRKTSILLNCLSHKSLTYSFGNGKPNPKIWWGLVHMSPYIPAGLFALYV